MKILHINTSGTGGAAIACQRLHDLMLQHGVDSNILYLYDNCPHRNNYFFIKSDLKKLFRRFINHMQYIIYQRDLLPYSYVFTEPTIVNANVQNLDVVKEADVIYLHWILGGFLNLSDIESLAKTGKKIICFMHDMWWMTGGCHHVFECKGHIGGCLSCPKHKHLGFLTSLQALRKKKIFNKYKNMVFVSPSVWMDSQASISFVLKETNHCVIPNVVPESIFYPMDKKNARSALDIPMESFVITFGTASNDDWAKGRTYLIRTIKKLKLSNVILCVYGSDYDLEISQCANVRVKYLGYLADPNQVMLANCASDLYISPSLAESFGQTILENLLCGTPVVAFDCTAISELIKHKVNGYLARYKDVDDMVEGITFFYNRKNSKVSIIDYSTDNIFDMHSNLFNRIK